MIMNPSSRLLMMDGLNPIISSEATLTYGSLMEADPELDLLFLGLKNGHAVFASLVKLKKAVGQENVIKIKEDVVQSIFPALIL